jgi:MinD-like ATPase involved in chromosome partitioning or flagellar assembly
VGVRIILAGPEQDALMSQAYPAFAEAELDVAGVVSIPKELVGMAAGLQQAGEDTPGIAVVECELYGEPERALQALAALDPTEVVVILPSWWAGEQTKFARLPNLKGGFTAPVGWPQVAQDLKARLEAPRREPRADAHGGHPLPAERPPTGLGIARMDPQARSAGSPLGEGPQTPPTTPTVDEAPIQPTASPHPRQRPQSQPVNRVVVFWSGPAGGTGRTALAMASGILAAEWGQDVVLLAFSEPAVSAYFNLSRTPNASCFFEDGDLGRAERRINWATEARIGVVLGPPRAEPVTPEAIGELVDAACAAHGLVLVDLPAAPPGGTPWAVESLRRVTDVVLVVPYSSTGVAAAVEALVAMRDAAAPGQVHLVLNRTHPGRVRADQVRAGIESVWGSCPDVVARLPNLPRLADALERAELPGLLLEPEQSRFLGGGGEQGWVEAVAALVEATTGLKRPVPVEEADEAIRERTPSGGPPRRGGLKLGKLIQIEVTE